MLQKLLRKRIIAALVAAGITIHLTSCGTILHPERRGQPTGRLDPGIVVLDAVGLLLFFVPGVIAFAVDFTTGAIYLPAEGASIVLPASPVELRTFRMSPAELTPEKIEDVIRDKTGQDVRLQPGAYRATRLPQINDISGDAWQRLQSNANRADVAFPQPRE